MTTYLLEKAIEAARKEISFYHIEPEAEIEFMCPSGGQVQDKINRTATDNSKNITEIHFSSTPDYAFFTGLRKILGDRYGAEGRLLANLLAADFNPQHWKKIDYDDICKDLLLDTKMVSLADPDGGTIYDTNVPDLIKRWGIDYTNIAPYDGTTAISPNSSHFIHLGSPKHDYKADFAWASNVISNVTVSAPREERDLWVYQTFAAIIGMLKPPNGAFLYINTLDPALPSACFNADFHDLIGVKKDKSLTRDTVLFHRAEEKALTPLLLASFIAKQPQIPPLLPRR
jgi:hypothetical protein